MDSLQYMSMETVVADSTASSIILPPQCLGDSCGISSRSINWHFEAMAMIIILFLGMFCNGLVLALFYRKPSLRTFSNHFVVSLTISHLLQSVLIMPTVVVTAVSSIWLFGDAWCQITGCLTICLNVASVLSILLIAVDRNCAVNNPLHYPTTITKKRTGLLIASTWTISVLVSLPPLFGASRIDFRPEWHTCTILWNSADISNIIYGSVLALIGFVIPLLNVGWIYFAMFRAARTNSARARRHSVTACLSDVIINVEPSKKMSKLWIQNFLKVSDNKTVFLRKSSACSTGSTGSKLCFGGDYKAARTGLFVVISFVFCWLPFFLSILSEPHLNIPESVRFLVTFTAFCACVVNPYLYVFRNKTSRSYAKKLLECHARRNRDFPDSKRHIKNTKKRVNKRNKSLACGVASSTPATCVLQIAKCQTMIECPLPNTEVSDVNNVEDVETLRTDIASAYSTPFITNYTRRAKIFSLHPARPLLHQDSTSSSDSSDLGVPSVLMDSTLNVNEHCSVWYNLGMRRSSSGRIEPNRTCPIQLDSKVEL